MSNDQLKQFRAVLQSLMNDTGLVALMRPDQIRRAQDALDAPVLPAKQEDFHIGVDVTPTGTHVQVWDGETKLYEQFYEMPASKPGVVAAIKAIPSVCWWNRAAGHVVFNNANGDDLILRKAVIAILTRSNAGGKSLSADSVTAFNTLVENAARIDGAMPVDDKGVYRVDLPTQLARAKMRGDILEASLHLAKQELAQLRAAQPAPAASMSMEILVEAIAGCIAKHMTVATYPAEVLSAAREIASKYAAPMPARAE